MNGRLALGFLVAPLVVPIGMLLMSSRESDSLSDLALEIAVFGYVWYIYSLIFTLVFAVPVYLLLRRRKIAHWSLAVLGGMSIGFLGSMSINGQPPSFSAKLVVLGGLAGLVFWLLAGSRDVSRSARSTAHDA